MSTNQKAAEYILIDEPRPGGMAQAVVNPVWPLLAVMFAGGGVSWCWFVFNGTAMGSPTKRREIVLAAGGFAGALAIVAAMLFTLDAQMLPRSAIGYIGILLTVWKLGICYWIYFVQSRTFGVYEYYGGPVRNGLTVLIAAALLAPVALRSLRLIPLGSLLYMAVQ